MKRNTLFILVFILTINTSFSQNDFFKMSGDIILITLPTTSLGATIIKDDKEGSLQFVKGAIVNQAVTQGLKLLIDKERPNGLNNNSFPSGHTSTTFQSASFIHKRYGFKYGLPAYLLASYTGFTRIKTDYHDIYDVLAGAIIGIASSYLFTTKYPSETDISLYSNLSNDNYVIGLSFSF